MATMKKDASNVVSDKRIYEVAHLFWRKEMTAPEIAHLLGITRTGVYDIIHQGVKKGLIYISPQRDEELRKKIYEKFFSHDPTWRERICVVGTSPADDNQAVPHEAARIALEKAKHVWSDVGGKAGLVTLGIGPGQATLDFLRHLGRMLESDPAPPRFRLVALTAGSPAAAPHLAATSLFHHVPDRLVGEKIGMFAGNLVSEEEFRSISDRPGVREAIAVKQKGNIDIVVSSMGAFGDKHDLLSQHLREAGIDVGGLRDEEGRALLGNVQYRPYSAMRFVRNEKLRAVTLFELEELVDFAGKAGKTVILMVRRYGGSKGTRARALAVLMQRPDMRLFSHLVLDDVTAEDLISDMHAVSVN
jgi:DNA-binding transcriptional regulator LsrR (DeoR family)